MISKCIYIVGKSDPHLAATHAIRSAGYKVGILQDTQAHLKEPETYDKVEFIDFDNLDQEITRLSSSDIQIDGLVCIFENYVVAKAKIAEYFNLPAPSVEAAEAATDKAKMRNAFLATDASISPNYRSVDTIDQALDFAATYGYPLILKPTNLVKSLLVFKCDDEQQLRDNFTYASKSLPDLYEQQRIHGRTPQLIIEEFIEGPQYSIAAFVDDNGIPHFCDGIVRIVSAQDIGVDDNYLYSRVLPAGLPDEITDEMFRISEIGVRALKMKSVPAHIELIHSPKGVKIVEIGARIGGYRPRMYGLSYGLDLTGQEIAIATAKTPMLNGAFSSYSAVYELFPKDEGLFQGIKNEVDPSQFTYYKVSAEGKKVGPAKNGYKAAAIIIASSPDKNHFDTLCRTIEKMEIKVAV